MSEHMDWDWAKCETPKKTEPSTQAGLGHICHMCCPLNELGLLQAKLEYGLCRRCGAPTMFIGLL